MSDVSERNRSHFSATDCMFGSVVQRWCSSRADAGREAYAAYLTVTGRFDEAIAAAKRRIELDPLTPEMRAALGRVYLFAGRYDDSIRALKQALELDPNHLPARYWLAAGYAAKGMDAEAVAACEDVLRSLPKEGESKLPASRAQVYATAGRRDDALRLMEHWAG
jgi:tetratricopeptide (TPR) repeat protein